MSGQGNGGGWPSTQPGVASGGGRSNNTGGSGPSGPSGGGGRSSGQGGKK
jgi:hypothetical protein